MAEDKDDQSEHASTAWGTWEELLLAFAVKRHGFKDWDSVAMEVQARCSLPNLLTTAHHCELKYNDLRRRFSSQQNGDVTPSDEEIGTEFAEKADDMPWLDELRKLRVAELRQEVQRRDVSILSLQLKVKTLEDERERSINEENSSGKPDLERSGDHGSENDKKDSVEPGPSEPEATDAKVAVAEEESNREGHSVNESSSTASKSGKERAGEKNIKSEMNAEWTGPDEPEVVRRDSKPVVTDSDNGSSDTVAKNPRRQTTEANREKKTDESSDLPDSAAQSNGGEEGTTTRESSEVQSTASLTMKKRLRKDISGGSSADEPPPPATVKSERLEEILRVIRAHKHSSLFESRLHRQQETDEYRGMVRQHLDLEKIQASLRRGSYSASALAFYRDLLLLFNNAIIFFPRSSPESSAARELRCIVSEELKKINQVSTSDPSPDGAISSSAVPSQPKRQELQKSDSLLAKQKSTAPIIVCRKRSSMSAKPSSATFGYNSSEQSNDDKKPVFDLKPPVKPAASVAEEQGSGKDAKAKEKTVTGTRSFKRRNDNSVRAQGPSVKKQNTGANSKSGSASKTEASKTDKKKAEATVSEKKRGATDFLKRIKQNSPADTAKTNTRSGGNNDLKKKDSGKGGEKGKERILRQSTEKKRPKEDNSPSKRSVGRPPKKTVETTAASTERGKETGGKSTSKRPRKRSRR